MGEEPAGLATGCADGAALRQVNDRAGRGRDSNRNTIDDGFDVAGGYGEDGRVWERDGVHPGGEACAVGAVGARRMLCGKFENDSARIGEIEEDGWSYDGVFNCVHR